MYHPCMPGGVEHRSRGPREREVTRRAREVSVALREVQRVSLDARQALARRLGLGVSDVNALDQLVFSTEPIGPAELAARVGMTTASATVLVDRLEKAGHLRRAPHPRDRRRQTLHPTDHAREEISAALSPLITALDATAAGLTADQAAAVVKYLTAAAEVLRAYASGAADLVTEQPGGQAQLQPPPAGQAC